MSRLATAERLEESPAESRISSPPHGSEIQPAVVADPFGPAASAAASSQGAAAILASGAMSTAAAAEGAPKKPFPWIPLALVASATAFGVTAALVNRPPAPAAVQAAPASAAPAIASMATAVAAAATVSAEPLSATPQALGKTFVAAAGGPKPATTATASAGAPAAGGRSLDLHSLTQNSNVAPSAEDPGDGPKAPGQCFSQGQVQSVIGMHQLAIRRSCWERDPTTKPTVNVSVSMTIGPDGSSQSVAVSGDEGSVAKCIENDVRGWRFPAMGCSQKTGFSFKFVRQ
jgi:hypothetical protein